MSSNPICKRGAFLPLIASALLLVGFGFTAQHGLLGADSRGASGEPIWIYDSELYVKHIEVADLNGDLVEDVIAGEYSSDYYGEPSRVLAINGLDGDTLWSYLLQDGVRSMTIGDINGDGVADVIAGASYQSSPTPDGKVHAINGANGTPFWTFDVGATISSVAIGDFNGDTYMDVAAGAFDEYVYAIDGENGTEIWRRFFDGLWINEVATGDVNGDNRDDVAFAHEYLAGWDNFLGLLDGTSGSSIWVDTVEYVVLAARLADVDADGDLEAIFGGIYSDDHGELFVRTSINGDTEWSYDLGSVNHTNGDIVIGIHDIDLDTDLDMVVGKYIGDYYLRAFEGNSSTLMWTSEQLDGYPKAFAFGDIDADGEENILVASSDRVEVLQAPTGKKFYYYAVAGTMADVGAADVDDNDTLDVIAGGGADIVGTPPDPGKSVWALRTVVSPVCWENAYGQYGNELTLANLNGDEYMDVVAVSSVDDAAFAFNGQDGSPLWTWLGTENLYATASGDFDNDGVDEVVVGGNDDQITAIESNGTTMWTFPAGNQIYRKCLQSTDLNGDGSFDVVAGSDDNFVRALNGPDGDTLWTYNIGGQVGEIELAQMDDMGPLDVVVAGANGANSVVVLEGATGALLWTYAASTAVEHVEVMDANTDGVMDVAAAVTPYSPKEIVMVDGATQIAIWTQPIGSASNTHSMSHGNLNGDKYPDLVVPGNSTDRVVWALDGDNGDTLWTFPVGGEVNCVLVSDVDYDGQDEVIAGSDDQVVYVINGLEGTEEWSYSTADDVMDLKVGMICDPLLPNIACVTFGSDGIVYVFGTLASGPLNNPPATPSLPDGDSLIVTHMRYQYVTSTTDEDGHQIDYGWQVANHDDTLLVWLGPYSSGDTCMYELVVTEAGVYSLSVIARDEMDAYSEWSEILEVRAVACGDANFDGIVNVSDVVYMIAFIFAGGPEPEPELAGDADCNGILNVTDAVVLVTYIFASGPPPCSSCP